jgi:hypothetical protein
MSADKYPPYLIPVSYTCEACRICVVMLAVTNNHPYLLSASSAMWKPDFSDPVLNASMLTRVMLLLYSDDVT